MRGDEDVGRLDVPVDDALPMGGTQPVGDLDRDLKEDLRGQRTAGDALLERLALQSFHAQEGLALMVADVVDGADVRMVERRGGARLALEALPGVRLVESISGQELERNEPTEPRVLGFVDLAHASGANLRDDLVVQDGLADHRSALIRRGATLPRANRRARSRFIGELFLKIRLKPRTSTRVGQ
jgi:hypothetical protein